MKYGLSQSQAARILGIKNYKLVSHWENGFRSPTEMTKRFIRLLLELPRHQSEILLKKLESYGDDDANS